MVVDDGTEAPVEATGGQVRASRYVLPTRRRPLINAV